MEEDDPHSVDLRRRHAVHAIHAARHPARFRAGPCAKTLVALRPAEGGTVPCRIDVFPHGIEAGQGYLPRLVPSTGEAEVACDPERPLQPIDRASALRLFGLAGTGHGGLVDDLGDALLSAWYAEGLGGHIDRDELAAAARSWEAERIAQAGLSEIRALFSATFAKAAGNLAAAATARFSDYTYNLMFRDEGLCALVAALGGLAPLAIERWDTVKRQPPASPAEFVHGVMRGMPMPGSHAITPEESGWLIRTFEGAPHAHVNERIGASLVTYRRALRFRNLGATDSTALVIVLAFAGLAGARHAQRNVLELMGDMGSPDGLPYAFVSGVKRHQDDTGLATDVIATKLATDAYDLWDAVWNAVGAQVAQEVASRKRPGVLPLLLWDARDPGGHAFIDGLRRLVGKAACNGKGSAGLLANVEPWVRAGRPGYEGDRLADFRRLRTFREIEFYRDRVGDGYLATLEFVANATGLDLGPEIQALAEEVAVIVMGAHERSLRQDYPEPAPLDEGNALDAETAPEAPGPVRGVLDADDKPSSGSGAWLKRATTLGQALSLRRNA